MKSFSTRMKIGLILGLVLLTVLLSIFSGCVGTVRGVASDGREIFTAVEGFLKPLEEKREQDRLDRAANLVLNSRRSAQAAR